MFQSPSRHKPSLFDPFFAFQDFGLDLPPGLYNAGAVLLKLIATPLYLSCVGDSSFPWRFFRESPVQGPPPTPITTTKDQVALLSWDPLAFPLDAHRFFVSVAASVTPRLLHFLGCASLLHCLPPNRLFFRIAGRFFRWLKSLLSFLRFFTD